MRTVAQHLVQAVAEVEQIIWVMKTCGHSLLPLLFTQSGGVVEQTLECLGAACTEWQPANWS